MLVNVNNIVKRGYKLSDCVLYNGKKYKIVAIDFAFSMFLLNGYNSRSSNINFEGDDLSSFVLYDSDETLDRKYSLWVDCDQISKVEDEVESCKEKYVKKYDEYKPSDFTNIDDKKSFEMLLSIKDNMSCGKLKCDTCPLNVSNDGCAVDLGGRYAKERLNAIIEMYRTYHLGKKKSKLYALYTGMVGKLFGEESFDRIVETNSYEDACNEARDICMKVYKAYEGRHGIRNEKECEQEGMSYEDEIKNWITFSVIEVTSETINIILEEDLSKSDIELLKKYNFN